MISTTETGHAKNVANFQQLISFCEGYGTAYNPSRNELSLAGIQNVFAQAQAALTDLKNAKSAFDIATNTRKEAFADLPKFSTQVVNALAASGVSSLSIADARGILRKMQGRRATEVKPAIQPAGTVAQAVADKQISVSQLSFDSLIDHFSKLVTAVAQQKEYNPNEANLSVAGLQAKLDTLNAVNGAVIKSFTGLSNARMNRNNVLYNPVTGITQIAAGVKLYIKSIFGATSPQYKQVSAISFTSTK